MFSLLKKSINFRNSDGFSLVELLVAVVIISILVTASYTSVSNLNNRQDLLTAGNTLKATLREVQSKAYTGEIDCSVCNCSSGSSVSSKGWTIDLTNRSYYGLCGVTTPSPQPTKVISLPTAVPISPFLTPVYPYNLSPDRVTFSATSPGVSNSGIICLQSESNPNLYYRISISRVGSITSDTDLVTSCP